LKLNAEFFEYIFPLKTENAHSQPLNNSENSLEDSDEHAIEELRRSKRQRKETSFGDDFYTYLINNDPLSFSEVVDSPDSNLWNEAIQV
jgi:uncharacterized protein YdcH (DUF465 family)